MAEEVELCVEIPPNMEDVWEEALDVDRLCRACANTNESMIPIFEGDGIEHELQAKIAKHLPVKITKEDGLPHQMCFQCASTLVAWHDMFTNCIEAEKKLTNLVNKAKDAKDDEQELQEMEEMEEQVIEEEVIETSIAEDMAIEKFTTDVQERTVREMEMDDDNREDDVEAAREDDVEGIDENSGKKEDRAGTTIRDQIMVMNQDQLHSMTMALNVSEKTLHLKSALFAKAKLSTTDNIIREILNYSKKNYGLGERESLKIVVNSVMDCDFESDNKLRDGLVVEKPPPPQSSDDDYSCRKCDCRFKISYHFKKIAKRKTVLEERSHEECNEVEEKVDNGQGITTTDTLQTTSINPNESALEEIEEKQQLLKCGECGEEFLLKDKYRLHRREHVRQRARERERKRSKEKITCKLCGKVFSIGGLRYHMGFVHNFASKRYKCEFCEQMFATKAFLTQHRRRHTGEMPYECDICGKKQRTSAANYLHMKYHSNERPHVCQICNASFKVTQQLTLHLTSHDEKNFMCEICGKAFSSNKFLMRHKLIHNQEKLFECPVCLKKFNVKYYLKNHLKIRHDMKLSDFVESQNEETDSVAESSVIVCNDDQTSHFMNSLLTSYDDQTSIVEENSLPTS